MKVLFGLSLFFSLTASAFIPPLAVLVKDSFEGRKSVPLIVILKHRIHRGTPIEIEETIASDHGRVYILWRSGGQTIAAIKDGATYSITKERSYPSRSSLFVRYFMNVSADSFRDALLNERFINRDQLNQYKPGFDPKGEPSTWALKENYLVHPGIFLSRVGDTANITVVGTSEGDVRRAVYFDQDSKNLSRLEWKDGNQIGAWNFASHGKFVGGMYPRRLSFDWAGETAVSSDTVAIREMKDKSVQAFRKDWATAAQRTPSMSPEFEAGLQILLSYR